MRYGSVCSGIEAASVAWHPLGWRASWLAEIEPFPSAVLAHHYPDVPNLGDMTSISRLVLTGLAEAPDVLVGGTPCQAFSVAGLRQSLADERGNLTLKFVELADAIDHVRAARRRQPAVIVWENVPGVLSTPDNAFGCFLGALAGEDCELQPAGKRWSDSGCVYGPARTVAWRIFDAQYFGLAQQRRRVFVVASARDDVDPAQVLFEWYGMRRDSAPSRQAREGVAAGTLRSTDGGSDVDHGRAGHLITMAHGQGGAEIAEDRAPTLTCNHEAPIAFLPGVIPYDLFQITAPINRQNRDETSPCHTLARDNAAHAAIVQPVAFSCKDHAADAGDLSPTLRAMGHSGSHANAGGQVAVAFMADDYKDGGYEEADTARPLTTSADRTRAAPIAAAGMQVRRLTPRECERLQGFPDDYTLIPWRKKPASECPDGPRYKALGNSMAVPVMRWIGRRLSDAITSSGGEV